MSGLFRRALATVVAVSFLLAQGGSGAAAPRPVHMVHGLSVPHAATVAVAVPSVRVQVPEPPRVRASMPPASSIRPKVVPGVRPLSGRHVPGPPMLRPSEIDGVLKAAAARRHASAAAISVPAIDAARRSGAPRLPGARPGTAPGTRQAQSLPSNPNGSGTGINPWWRYQEENVPGGGHLMVNVGTGNLLLQDDDMSVPHKGIAMAFRRTYNSQSGHNVNATDAAGLLWEPPGMYGNGWTNTFDAHLVRSTDNTVFSVFDIDGARYDYSSPANGVYVPGPGNHNTLTFDGNCGLLWTKKSGTTYYFYRPNPNAPCATMPASGGSTGGYAGRLYQIIGRNRNTSITFSYSWDNGNASATGKISSIMAQTESGLATTLSFADVNGYRLLQQLTYPDAATTVSYGYDTNGNLTSVSRPANNASGIRPQQAFGYQAFGSGFIMQWAASPRWNAACATSGCGTDGGTLNLGFAGTGVSTSTVNFIGHWTTANPTIPDSTGSVGLQSGYPTTAFGDLSEFYTTGVTTPTFRDTDGHMTNWVVDGAGRPTQTQECTASTNQGQACTGTWLVTNETWDANNNLTASIEPRGNVAGASPTAFETDYAYDANGNAIAVAQPSIPTSVGTIRPTQLFDYDANNNVLAFCDAVATHQAGGDWTAPPPLSDSRCSTLAQSTGKPYQHLTYSNPSYQPYGQLATVTTAMGYTTSFGYATSQQAGTDFGLPTTVTGQSFTQADGTTITPTQTFWYDTNGELRCYSKGRGTTVLTADSLGRVTMVADPDDTSANGGSLCGKSTGQAGWNTQATTAYYPDGSVQYSQTPAQRAGGVSTAFTYDLDGNESTETHHYGCAPGNSCTAGATSKWYDGADRLVEVALPHDGFWDWYSSTWITRYLYDLTQGGSVYIGGTGYLAYGGLYKTQEWVPASQGGTTAWTDLKGSASDAVDRQVTKYSFSPSSNTTVRASTTLYDATNATVGLLASVTDPLGVSTTYTYDNAGRASSMQFNDGGVTPYKSFVYDPAGRIVSATGAVYGTETMRYDADGKLLEKDEPTSGSITSPARLTYDYYPNGQRKDVNIASTALNAAPFTSYSYRADGRRSTVHVGFGLQQGNFISSSTDAGRVISRSDPFTGSTMPNPQSPVSPGTTYGPTTWAYDTAGQLSTLTLPQTLAYQLIAHDDEGAVLGWTGSYSNIGPVRMTYTNTIRGENALITLGNSSSVAYRAKIANGAAVASPVYTLSKGNPPPGIGPTTVDPVNAVVTSTSKEQYVANPDPEGPPWEDCGLQTKTDLYDAASRLIGKSTSMNVNTANPDCTFDPGPTLDEQFTYDAENHHVTTPIGSPGLNNIWWSPGGNAYKIQSANVHYDGSAILFVTDASGSLTQAKIEAAGDIDGAGQLTVLDRGHSNQYVGSHSNGFYSGISLGTTVYKNKDQGAQTIADIFPGSTNNPSCTVSGCASAGNLEYDRLEGFEYSGLTFQGARAVDESTGKWTTPDAYAGDVHDPMSQKSFMWDRNNPYSYSDPSGFSPQRMMDCGCGGSHAYVSIETAEALYGSHGDEAQVFMFGDGSNRQVGSGRGVGQGRYFADEAQVIAEQNAAESAGFKTVDEYRAFQAANAEAAARYPSKVGRFDDHHVDPKYLGGAANGRVVRIPAPYHQLITNEFRSLAPYGSGARVPGELGRIIDLVYGKYPIPGP
jgi:YD repeat-containing protein